MLTMPSGLPLSKRSLRYLPVYLVPGVVFFSLTATGVWTFTAVVVLFGIIPLAECLTRGSTRNLTAEEELEVLGDPSFDRILYSLVPLQAGLLLFFLYRMSEEGLPLTDRIGMITAMGMACGVLGINAAHELGHRSSVFERTLSRFLLLTTLYMHFHIEHNRGHHKNVSTDLDPASSRYGESVYAFFLRSIYGGWISAWQLEAERLRRMHRPVWGPENEMLWYQIIQAGLVGLIFFGLGETAALSFLAAALVGVLLLETVNYIEHYGLRRRRNGLRYERTLPAHSWNSNHPLGRAVLLELSRHSDHHYQASRKFPVLRHFDESPQMPTGYPGMMLLSLVPPLWFLIMHREIKHYRQTRVGAALA